MKQTLKRCSVTKMLFPLEFFGPHATRGTQNFSLLGSLWINVSQRAVNGRYAETRAAHYPRNSHHRMNVTMLEEWVHDATAFAWYILTELGFPRTRNGQKLTLDRINNRKGYVPGNLRWATPIEQASNRNGRHGT